MALLLLLFSSPSPVTNHRQQQVHTHERHLLERHHSFFCALPLRWQALYITCVVFKQEFLRVGISFHIFIFRIFTHFIIMLYLFIKVIIYIFIYLFKNPPTHWLLFNDCCHKEVYTDEVVRNVFMTYAKSVISLLGWFTFLRSSIWFFRTVKKLL